MSRHQPDVHSLSEVLHALAFAAHKHRDQRRKDPAASPYINHPIALANVLINEGGVHDTSTLCAALLHDTVEDTETTPEELEAEFGTIIRDIVLEVTDDKLLSRDERKRLQIVHSPTLSHPAKLVKLADKICNLRDVATNAPSSWDLARRQQYFDWAKQVVDGLRGAHPTLEVIFDQAYQQRPSR
jgi:guanosine-3',5'-bis(diphosphate) 3'-pyrophosphohydrolase